MKRKLPALAAAASAVALCAYRAVKGYGIFNKLRFPEEHSAVTRYVETHYPGAVYSSIEDTGRGYSTVITDRTQKIHLHFTKTNNGVYIFNEKVIQY